MKGDGGGGEGGETAGMEAEGDGGFVEAGERGSIVGAGPRTFVLACRRPASTMLVERSISICSFHSLSCSLYSSSCICGVVEIEETSRGGHSFSQGFQVCII